MKLETRDPSQLSIKQTQMQRDADAIVDMIGLERLLSDIGKPTRVGSSALGLMVRRDIDITVSCKKLDEDTQRAVVDLAGRLAMHASVGSVHFRNDTGFWNNAVDEYPDGLYLNLTYRDRTGEDWTFDIWFVDEPERQPDLKHLHTIPPKLTSSAREAILTIKSALADGSSAGEHPSSFQVYSAVLDDGVTDLAGFKEWLADTGRR